MLKNRDSLIAYALCWSLSSKALTCLRGAGKLDLSLGTGNRVALPSVARVVVETFAGGSANDRVPALRQEFRWVSLRDEQAGCVSALRWSHATS